MLAGSVIDANDLHHKKLQSEIAESFDSDSKRTDASAEQPLKLSSPIVSTLAGMQISRRRRQFRNARS
jgi:hypothetical protein